jgi:hypothetical protein
MTPGEAEEERGRRSVGSDGIDAILWLLAAAAILFLIPIGFVSNDGLGHSRDFAAGSWHLDPNHLLFEPLGAWWQNAWMRHGYGGDPVDALKLLSALAGALAAGLFRWGVAPRLTGTRWEANHATAWLAFSSAFLRLWVSDETHMIQMPFVVAIAWLALLCRARPSFGRGLALGAAAGLAALTFISNLLIGAAMTLLLIASELRRRAPRRAATTAAAVGLGTALAAGVPLLFAWLGTAASAESSSFLAWLTRYGGGRVGERVEGAYGLVRSWRGVGEAIVRAGYGAASALVDLTPVAAAVRDHQAPSLRVVLGGLAFLAAGGAMLAGLGTALRQREEADRGALLIVAAWLAAILGFGIFWNNSDDQFYFQLAPAFGALAARMTARRSLDRRRGLAIVLTLSLAGLLWNLIDVASDRVLYPRHERMALLEREVRGACLAVYPGFDEPEVLLAMSRPAAAVGRTSITNLAVGLPAVEGLGLLHRRIERCLDAGGRVVLIDLYDTPPERNPWKYLRRLGYDHAAVERALADLPVESASRQVGPFKVRGVRGVRRAGSGYFREEPRRNR